MSESVERVEMARLAGRLIDVFEYLEKLRSLRRMEDGSYPTGLSKLAENARFVHERLKKLSLDLPMGPLEAFGQEHPLFADPIDGPYCGYGAAEGKPYSCPVHDPALHWDVWELLGTRYKRPAAAVRSGE